MRALLDYRAGTRSRLWVDLDVLSGHRVITDERVARVRPSVWSSASRGDQKSCSSNVYCLDVGIGIAYRFDVSARAVGYIRVSTVEQAREGFSIPAQRRRIEAYCEAQGWQLVEVFADEGLSGASIDRPEFTRMLDAVLGDGVTKVVFVKLDRLGRCAWQLGQVREQLEARGVGVVSITEQFDTSTSIGRFFWTMLAAFAEFERDLIRERTAAGREEKARRGVGWVSGRVPYGYALLDGELVPDPETGEVVERIFRMAARGASNARIVSALNREGVASPGGEQWDAQAVRRILRRPIYGGSYEYRGHRVESPEIVSRRVWRRAQHAR